MDNAKLISHNELDVGTGFDDISISEFQLFRQVARLGSINKASRTLKLEPSAVSKALKRLESKVGKVLLNRSHGGVQLTRDGLQFRSTADEIIDAVDNAHLAHQKDAARAVLTVGAHGYLNKYLLVPSLMNLQKFEPKYRFRILDLAPNQLSQAVWSSTVELLLVSDVPDLPKHWERVEVGELRWVLVVSKSHSLSGKVSLSTVMNQKFLVPTYWESSGLAIGEDFLPIPSNERQVAHEVTNCEAATTAVKSSQYAAFVPEIVVQQDLKNGLLKRLEISSGKEVKRKLYLLLNTSTIKMSFKKAVVRSLQEKFHSKQF